MKRAEVRVRGERVASGRDGLLVLAGVTHDDSVDTAKRLAGKLMNLRVFEDDAGKMNLSIEDAGGEIVVVPQFTLYGDVSRGRRPSWIAAAPPEHAGRIVEALAAELERRGARVGRGAFREHMEVELVNDGPVTLLLEG